MNPYPHKTPGKPLKPALILAAAAIFAMIAPAQILADPGSAGGATDVQNAPTNNAPQTTSPPKPAPSAGLLNDWLREQAPAFRAWDIGGQFRIRYSDSEGAVPAASTMTSVPSSGKPQTTPVNPNNDFIAGKPNSSDELLLREKVHIGYTPVSWFSAFGEFRNSTENWDRRLPSPDTDKTDLQQAWVMLGDPAQFPLTAKIGRQELIYGDQRFVGNSDWVNTGRTFDAAKLCWAQDSFWIDAFASRVVVPHEDHFDEANDYDWFSGVYASSDKLLPWQESQVYFLSRNVSPQAVSAAAPNVPGTPTTARDIYTFGFRMKSLPGKIGGWDYGIEAAGQLGSIYNATLKRRLEQEAYAVFANGGYTWEKAWGSPRLGLGYEGGSGDSNPNDGKSQTFDNLLGASHRFYGQMNLFCERNMNIPRVSASIKPLKNLSLNGDYLLFWLADKHDYLYPASGSGRSSNGYGNNNPSSFVGSELDLTANYDAGALGNLQLGYGHFFIGDDIRQSVARNGVSPSMPTGFTSSGSSTSSSLLKIHEKAFCMCN